VKNKEEDISGISEDGEKYIQEHEGIDPLSNSGKVETAGGRANLFYYFNGKAAKSIFLDTQNGQLSILNESIIGVYGNSILVITTKNEEGVLPDLLSSIRSQTFKGCGGDCG